MAALSEDIAVARFAALASEARMRVFRLLIQAGPNGVAAGRLSEALDIAPSNLSAHLNTLRHAGLVSVRRDGRSRIYAANLEATGALVEYLVADCCDGHPEICRVIDAGRLAG